jgi:hypothetical protein
MINPEKLGYLIKLLVLKKGGQNVMSKGLRIMLFWSLGMPIIVTILRITTDYLLGRNIELFSYSAVFLGIAAGGLIFAGPLNYYISKSREE